MINLFNQFGEACAGGDFLGFPKWYKYLDGVKVDTVNKATGVTSTVCSPRLNSINDIYLILAAVIEMLLRISTILAVGYVIYGGVQYVVSQGESDKTAKAKSTIVNALIGLVVSLTAATVVAFIAGKVH